MERTLSLVLDDRGLISLTLYKADNVTMDEYTTKNFENSDEIREVYKEEIEAFLKENENYINAIKEHSGRDFKGRIVLLQVDPRNIMELEEKRVLYKKHLVAFKELCKDRVTMQEFSRLEQIGCNTHGLRRLVSPYVHREISYSGNFKIKSRVQHIERELSKDKKEPNTDFYEVLRIMIKAYNIQRQTRKDLPTIDKIYKDYLESKEQKQNNNQNVEKRINQNPQGVDNQPKEEKVEQEEYYVDGVRYYQDEQELFDLEDIERIESSDFQPDGLGRKDDKSIK